MKITSVQKSALLFSAKVLAAWHLHTALTNWATFII